MKRGSLIFLISLSFSSYAQEHVGDPESLKRQLSRTPADTNRILLLCDIAFNYRYDDVDSAYHYASKAAALSNILHYQNGIAWSHLLMGVTYSIRGHVPKAISYYEKCIHLADSLHKPVIASRALTNIGWCMFDLEDYYRAIDYFKRALRYEEQIGEESYIITLQTNIGQAYLAIQNFREAEQYLSAAHVHGKLKNTNYGYLLNLLSALRIEQQKYDEADSLLKEAQKLVDSLSDKIDKADNRYYSAKLKLAQGKMTAARDHALEALSYYKQLHSKVDLGRVYKLLSDIESRQQHVQQSLDFLLLSNAMRDSVHHSSARYSEFLFEQREQEKERLQQQRDKERLRAEKQSQQLIWLTSLFVFTAAIAGLSFFVWQKQRTNKRLRVLNNELIRKEEDIASQNNLLQELNVSKDKLFSIIGHDLRGPLLTLTGFLKLLSHHSDSLSKEELKRSLSELDRSLKNLFNLLENLLEWSLSQTGTIDFKPEVFDIAVSVKENKELLDDVALNKNITIVNECDTSLLVNAHRHSIQTVIRNLVSNAIKFTEPGGQITIRTERTGDFVRVVVTDTGLGISADVIPQLFKIGFKHSKTGTAKEKGSGLGLLLCKDFVEKNGGAICVESKQGSGSTFSFTVPAAR
jgi:two-component system sensor histidine kinase/response regulator